MITKVIDDNSISVIPEDSDDLLNLRRAIKKEDVLVGDTTRVIKQDKEYSRPDRGERVRIRLALRVENVSLDNVLDRLRVAGTITESNNEAVPHGSHHSMVIKPNDGVTIKKKRWLSIEKKLVKSGDQKVGFVLVAIDTGECGVARLKGTHLQIMPNIYSGAGGKRYKTEFKIEKFFDDIIVGLLPTVLDQDRIILFGPGTTKNKFANHLAKNPISKKHKIQIVEGIDSGGEDGVYTFTKSASMKEIMSESKLAKVAGIIDEVMLLANKKSSKFAMGFEEIKKAVQYGAIDSLVFSDRIIQTEDEEEIIELLNEAESKGVRVFSVDSTTDVGKRVTGLGGILATLRFAIG
ncbi:MAG: mRNA surveillance protein pelota [Nitrosopumilaceae archaeon]|nr:mRNA surveillance protein pelota [Nitrosopumilaceae archaeon]NIU00238.1 mRNA surveillance protein pelota [Nitrosopumilaceae archaeon]NIU86650.1 mRNA surveillance protein pelota [Nitrosopumilaceae archaeon]NIV65345.1 mRNA surveillance protein pelota [Nitrosopumilaceae archaeon]NIX60840.1 mRNA surveillance protein pelota [Nitrosopumilaceae archaeon]